MPDTIGTRIAKARTKRGMTQAELADALGTTAKIVSHLETSFRTPSLRRLYTIAGILDVSPASLLSRTSPWDTV